ncbi:hypothetical protein OSI88_25595, partial [Mycobacterium ulcerans]
EQPPTGPAIAAGTARSTGTAGPAVGAGTLVDDEVTRGTEATSTTRTARAADPTGATIAEQPPTGSAVTADTAVTANTAAGACLAGSDARNAGGASAQQPGITTGAAVAAALTHAVSDPTGPTRAAVAIQPATGTTG